MDRLHDVFPSARVDSGEDFLDAASHFHTVSIPENESSASPVVTLSLCLFQSSEKNETKKQNKKEKNPFSFLRVRNPQNFQKFSNKRLLIQHLRTVCDHVSFHCPGVRRCRRRCSLVSWRTVCKRQPWLALSGDTVWWRGRASGPYTPVRWAGWAAAAPGRRCPAQEETQIF